MTEDQNFIIEAALFCGFEIVDDECTVFKCTDEVLLKFAEVMLTAKIKEGVLKWL